MNDFVAFAARLSNRIGFPHGGRWQACSHHQTCQQTAHDTVSDDQVGGDDGVAFAANGNCVVGGGGQGQQNRIGTQTLVNGNDTAVWHHHGGTCATEEVVGTCEGVGARNKHPLAHFHRGRWRRMFDHAHGFITRDQGISQTWESWHGAGPKQALCAGADAAESDIHHKVLRTRIAQVKLLD